MDDIRESERRSYPKRRVCGKFNKFRAVTLKHISDAAKTFAYGKRGSTRGTARIFPMTALITPRDASF